MNWATTLRLTMIVRTTLILGMNLVLSAAYFTFRPYAFGHQNIDFKETCQTTIMSAGNDCASEEGIYGQLLGCLIFRILISSFRHLQGNMPGLISNPTLLWVCRVRNTRSIRTARSMPAGPSTMFGISWPACPILSGIFLLPSASASKGLRLVPWSR